MNRFLFHSFPRPRKDEDGLKQIARGLQILSHMCEAGLILAPELVKWNVDAISGGKEKLEILQRRMCFTELANNELADHASKFGPITLACNIQKLRDSGAAPVIYAPQGGVANAISQISTFAVRGTYHTQAVLKQLSVLQTASDPAKIQAQYNLPELPAFTLNLSNTAPDGKVVASASVPAIHVQQLMQHVAFNNIPFEHSIEVLEIFLNMFYPTDDEHADDQLGYYRQREWRFIGTNLVVHGHQVARRLKTVEQQKLSAIDKTFWEREITVDGKKAIRAELALLYNPAPEWSIWDVVEKVIVPKEAELEAKKILGELVLIETY